MAKSSSWRTLVAVLGVMLVAGSAHAQRRVRRTRVLFGSDAPRLGVHVGYSFDVDKALLGVQASLPLEPRLDFYPSFDYYTVSPGSLWGVNADVKYRPPTVYGSWYLGGGLNLSHASAGGASSSQARLNLFSGLEGRRGPIRPYVEARLLLGNGSSFQLQGGLSFPLH